MNSNKKITLIRPHMLIPRYSFTGLTVPPLGLAYVASRLKEANYEVNLIDAVGEAVEQHITHHDDYILHGLSTVQILDRIEPDTSAIGISCMFSHEFPVYRELIQAVRERFPNTPIIAGGEHITALPNESFLQCPALDVAVFGEGEETIVALMETDFSDASLAKVEGIAWRNRNGEIITTSRRGRVRNIDKLPRPAWELIPLQNYWKFGMGLGVNRGKSMPMLATRGCPYQCTFCSNPLMWTTRWRAREPEEVLEEMKSYIEKYGVENFDFYDLTAIVHKPWIMRFAAAIEKSGLKFTYQLPSGTRSEAIDREVARALQASGCRNMTYAPESGSPDTLTRIKKRISTDRMLQSMRDCLKEGLNIKANIIIGFPGETMKDLFWSFRFILQMAVTGTYDVTIQPFSAYPGTELFDQLRRENKIKDLDDAFFYSLADYSDLSKSVSWSDHLSSRTTLWFRTIGMISFYIVSYSLRPWRLFKMIQNLIKGKQESRLDRALYDLFQRRKALAPNVESGTSESLAKLYI